MTYYNTITITTTSTSTNSSTAHTVRPYVVILDMKRANRTLKDKKGKVRPGTGHEDP
jgi:hypothetical protein